MSNARETRRDVGNLQWNGIKRGRVCKKRFIREERLSKRREIEEISSREGEENNVYSKVIWKFERSQTIESK